MAVVTARCRSTPARSPYSRQSVATLQVWAATDSGASTLRSSHPDRVSSFSATISRSASNSSVVRESRSSAVGESRPSVGGRSLSPVIVSSDAHEPVERSGGVGREPVNP